MAVRDIPELKNDILVLKKATGAAVLVHTYQDPDLADVADAVGDCVELAVAFKALKARKAIVCGVRYVAETISLLCPDREVVLAHPQARCPMSTQVYPGRVRAWREENPGVCVVCSVQFSAALKAECDLCVTQNNVLEVMAASGASRMLLLADSNLGAYVSERLPDKQIELWPCSCPAMNATQPLDVELGRSKWPNALLAANCCLRNDVSALADMVGSTAQIIAFCEETDRDVIIADEVSVCSLLKRRRPDREFCQIAPSKLICSNMKLTGLVTLERALNGEFGVQISLPPEQARLAAAPLLRMLSLTGGQWDI